MKKKQATEVSDIGQRIIVMSTWQSSSILKEWLLDFFGDGYIDGNLSLAHPLQRQRDVDGPGGSGVPGPTRHVGALVFEGRDPERGRSVKKRNFGSDALQKTKMAIKHHHFCYIGRFRYIFLMILFPL